MNWNPRKRVYSPASQSEATTYSWPVRKLRNRVFALLLSAMFLASSGLVAESASAQESPPSATAGSAPQPTDAQAVEQRADLYMVRKYYPEAAELYRKLTAMQPKNALFQNKLGIAYHQMQNLDMAKRSYRRAIQLNPQYAQAINNLAAVEYAQKNYRPAILTYLKALQITPGDAVIYSNLGTAYFAFEKFEYAVASYRYALLLDPMIFRRSGRVGTIVQQHDERNSAELNFYLAKTYAGLGDAENTLQYLRKAWEEGFPDILKAVNEDKVFAFLAGDTRFLDLMLLFESSEKEAAGGQPSP